MTAPLNERLEAAEAKVMELFEASATLSLDLKSEVEAYSLDYTHEKVTLCGAHMEKLSDISMDLTRISMEVMKALSAAQILYNSKYSTLKLSSSYEEQSRDFRRVWVENQLVSDRETLDRWTQLSEVVSQVREAVGERVATLKRLDSDLRLHVRLIETKKGLGGATSPSSYRGSKDKDFDI